EDGIRDFHVTGVQTCALPIFGVETAFGLLCQPVTSFDAHHGLLGRRWLAVGERAHQAVDVGVQCCQLAGNCAAVGFPLRHDRDEIGRASCRERAESSGGAVAL